MTGAEVRRIRHGLHLTQAALARALGVTRVTVARWEIGVYAIPEPTARLLQRVRDEGRRAKRPGETRMGAWAGRRPRYRRRNRRHGKERA